jgi:hypothetical protein
MKYFVIAALGISLSLSAQHNQNPDEYLIEWWTGVSSADLSDEELQKRAEKCSDAGALTFAAFTASCCFLLAYVKPDLIPFSVIPGAFCSAPCYKAQSVLLEEQYRRRQQAAPTPLIMGTTHHTRENTLRLRNFQKKN